VAAGEDQLAPSHALTLPQDLHASITKALATVTTAQWTREAQALSERYRARRAADQPPLATGRPQALGYAALVMPATYAQLHGALAATAARIPQWMPATLLDLGSGPGTALWAAAARWSSLTTLTAWEREAAFIGLGRELARGSVTPAIRDARWERIDLRHLDAFHTQRYDLVVLGHVLNELSAEMQRAVVAYAWERTAGVLLLIEPGTSAAFPIVRSARDLVVAAGGHTLAPCVHDAPCPLVNDWCHFPQRLIRPNFQRRARGAPSEWEDTKYAYAALARFVPDAPLWSRVIREPTSNKVYAEVKVSSRTGIAHLRALKRDRESYRRMRRIAWGATLAESPAEPVLIIEHERLP
jgi:ribosomal protein RSM22 (predicted rRNA methylase)